MSISINQLLHFLYTPKMKHFFLAVFLAGCSMLNAQNTSQNTGLDLPEVNALVQFPNSPEAEAFARYGNVPVSYYTGKPNVAVPIYTIQGKETSVPISLTYDASGIKVQSISTIAGAGWNLNVGGMVTRQIHGLADGMISGGPTYPVDSDMATSLNAYINSLQSSSRSYRNFESYEHTLLQIRKFHNSKYENSLGELDLLPDIYSFYAPGVSGSFVIDPQTGDAISLKDPDIKASYTITGFNKSIDSWKITNADGTVYKFDKAEETTTSYTSSDGSEGTRVYNSAWYLTQMISANKKDTFDFIYTNGQYWDQPQLYHNRQISQNRLSDCGQTHNYNPVDHEYITTSNLNDFRIKQSNLRSITHNGIEVVSITQATERLDLKGREKLDHINIMYNGSLIKSFSFHHSYFTSGSPTNEKDYRLRLDFISITGHNPKSLIPRKENEIHTYKFSYFGEDILPSRESLAIDGLGYFNGAYNNRSLIPKYTDEYNRVFFGANRKPDFNSRMKGMLQEIYYPTGGSTQFEFDHLELSTVDEVVSRGESLIEIGSGADPNAKESDYSCDDGFWYFPKTSTVTFTVSEDEVVTPDTGYYGDTTIEGNYSQTGRMFFMAIYKSAPPVSTPKNYTTLANGCIQVNGITPPLILCAGECKSISTDRPLEICYDGLVNPPVDDGIKTFCEIKKMIENADSDIVYSSYAIPLNGSKLGDREFFFLPAGTYKIFMANSLLGVSAHVHRKYGKRVAINTWNHNPIVSKTIDKTNQGETYIKSFEYLKQNIQQQVQLHTVKTTTGNVAPGCYRGKYETLERHTSNLYSATPYEVTYPMVRETIEDAQGNKLGATVYEYYDQKFYIPNGPYGIAGSYTPEIGLPYIETNPLQGQLKKMSQYDASGRILKSSTSVYDFTSTMAATGTNFYSSKSFLDICTVAVPGEVDPNLKKLAYLTSTKSPDKVCSSTDENIVINSWRNVQGYSDKNIRFFKFASRLLSTQSKDYRYDTIGHKDSIVQNTVYSYGSHHNLPIAVSTTVNNGHTTVINTQYPEDLSSPTSAEQGLIAQNRIATPIQVELLQKDNTTILSSQTQHTMYDNSWGNAMILPQKISTTKNNATLEDRVVYHKYDNKGNPLEVSKADGSHSIYIWGYQQQYPIAKIENGIYAEVSGYIADLQAKSNTDTDNCRATDCKEQQLRDALQTLRDGLPNAMVTTYTYDPLIGVTSMTDPKGYTVYYEYDGFSRLQHIRDAESNITAKYYYNHTGIPHDPLVVNITSGTWANTNTSFGVQSDVIGGSGNYTYYWKITKPGNQIVESTGKDMTFQSGATVGMATIFLEVRDLATGKTETANKSISIYTPLEVNSSSISYPSTHLVNTSAAFDISPTGGSGNYTYSWEIRGKGARYTTAQKSFDLMMGCKYYGQVTVTCTVQDITTGSSQTVSTTMSVKLSSFSSASITTTPPESSPPRTQKFQVQAKVNGGIGGYTYKWYVDGVHVSSSPSMYVTLNCGSSKTALVSCTVTDTCTGTALSASRSFTITNARCSGGFGGGPGVGNPKDDSDNSKQ